MSKGQGDHIKHSYRFEEMENAYAISELFINYDENLKMVEGLHIDKVSGDTGGGLTVINGIKTNLHTQTIIQFRGSCSP